MTELHFINELKTVYLNEGKGIKEVLLDGYGVRIKQNKQADILIPIKRIARLIVFGNVKLDSGVICNLLSQGSVVNFFNTKGVWQGQAYKSNSDGELEKILVMLLETEGGLDKYLSWRNYAEKAERIVLARRFCKKSACKWEIEGLRSRAFNQFYLSQLDKGINIDGAEKLKEYLTALLSSLCANILLYSGISPAIKVGRPEKSLPISEEFSLILQPLIMPMIIQNLKKSHNTMIFNGKKPKKIHLNDVGKKLWSIKFEKNKLLLEKDIERLTRKFSTFIRENSSCADVI